MKSDTRETPQTDPDIQTPPSNSGKYLPGEDPRNSSTFNQRSVESILVYSPIIQAPLTVSIARIVNGLRLLTIGDALGLPSEGKTAEEISNQFGRISSFLSPELNSYLANLKDSHAPLRPGTVSDDTQLTLAVLQAIINQPHCQGPLTMEEIVDAHIAAYDETTLGYSQ